MRTAFSSATATSTSSTRAARSFRSILLQRSGPLRVTQRRCANGKAITVRRHRHSPVVADHNRACRGHDRPAPAAPADRRAGLVLIAQQITCKRRRVLAGAHKHRHAAQAVLSPIHTVHGFPSHPPGRAGPLAPSTGTEIHTPRKLKKSYRGSKKTLYRPPIGQVFRTCL